MTNREPRGNWIWNGLPPGTPNVYLEARREFDIEGEPGEAELRISANQEYVAFLNGQEIGRGPSPADSRWKYFDVFDPGSVLRCGRNVLAVLVYNFGAEDVVTGQLQGPGGLFAELDIGAGSEIQRIRTDDSWKVRRSPRWVERVSRQHQWNGFREIYLADREDGWELPGYDDTAWENAVIIAGAEQPDGPWPRLLEREIPHLSRRKVQPLSIVRAELNLGGMRNETSVLAASNDSKGAWAIDASKPGSMPGAVFDFGREIVGYPELTMEAPQGGVVQLRYGESLDLQLYDTFVMKPGTNRLKPFGRRAFRYLQVSVQAAPAAVTVTGLVAEFVHYPFDESGSFRSNDPLLNRIWEIGVYTTKVNSQDHLEDCPLRERALWVADAVVMGRVIYHAFGDERLLRKCLLQGARIQNEDGSIPGTGPERNAFLLPDFCAHWLFGVCEHWQYAKDRTFAEEVWPAVERLLGWFRDQEDENGLFARADRDGWWCFIDWADYIDRRDRVTAVSCFYHKALHLAAGMAKDIGRPELAEEWTQRAVRLRASIRAHLRHPDSIVFADCLGPDGLSRSVTAQTNFAALWSGVMEEEVTERFLEEWFGAGRLPELRGAFFYHVVLEALIERGRAGRAMEIIRAYWGGMLERGATTWWETFDPSTPACTIPSPYQGNTPTYLIDHIPVSACHGWGASPSYILTQYVLGVDLRLLGDGIVRLHPHPGDLAWAEGTVPTRFGPIRAAWRRAEDATIRLEAEVPEGVRVEAPDSLELKLTQR